jgi:hypothetical protein
MEAADAREAVDATEVDSYTAEVAAEVAVCDPNLSSALDRVASASGPFPYCSNAALAFEGDASAQDVPSGNSEPATGVLEDGRKTDRYSQACPP